MMEGRGADSFEAILQTAKELTASLKKQRKQVRGIGCIKPENITQQLEEIDAQLAVLKELHSHRKDFLQAYALAAKNNPKELTEKQAQSDFYRLMRRIVSYGGQDAARRLHLYQLAVAYN